jgi:hypothetical protein
MRNRSNEMIPIQDIDIDAQHGPLHRSTSIHHPLRLPIHLHTCSLLIIPSGRGRGRAQTARRTAPISTVNIGHIRRIIFAWKGCLPIRLEWIRDIELLDHLRHVLDGFGRQWI